VRASARESATTTTIITTAAPGRSAVTLWRVFGSVSRESRPSPYRSVVLAQSVRPRSLLHVLCGVLAACCVVQTATEDK